MIRVGLLGCGFMGNMHAACYAALADLGVKLTAVSDQALDAAQALADYIRVIREEQTKRDSSGLDPLVLAMETYKDKKRYGGKQA